MRTSRAEDASFPRAPVSALRPPNSVRAASGGRSNAAGADPARVPRFVGISCDFDSRFYNPDSRVSFADCTMEDDTS